VADDFVQRGKELILRKQFPEAVRVCRLGLLARPSQVEGRLLLGTALLSLGRYDEVLAEMRVALQLDRESVLGHVLKGEALLRKGDARQAVEVLMRALEIDGGNLMARALLEEARGQLPVERARPDDPTRLIGPEPFAEAAETRLYPAHAERKDAGATVDAGEDDATIQTEQHAPEEPFDEGPAAVQPVKAFPGGSGTVAPAGGGTSAPPVAPSRTTGPLAAVASAPVLAPPVVPATPPPALPRVEATAPLSRQQAASASMRVKQALPGLASRSTPPASPSSSSSPSRASSSSPTTVAAEASRSRLEPPLAAPRTPSSPLPAAVPTDKLPARKRAPAFVGGATATEAVRAPGRRTGWWLFPFVLACLLVVAGGVAGGIYLRNLRLARQEREVRAQAERAAAVQTVRGYRQAEAIYQKLLDQRDDAAVRDALLRLRAARAAELGVPGPELSGSPDGAASADQEAAWVYQALAAGDAAAALERAKRFAARHPGDRDAGYLVGRALALSDGPDALAEAAQALARAASTPLGAVALGDVEARRGRWDEALGRYADARKLVADHPAAVVAAARAQAAAGKLPAGTEPDVTLAGLAAQAHRDPETVDLSPAQAREVTLTLAEVKLARGDTAAARQLLEELGKPGDRDPAIARRDLRFGAALVHGLARVGDPEGARAEAEAWAAATPSGRPRLWLAELDLAAGRLDAAQAELTQAGGAALGVDGALVGGELGLRAHDPARAARALDVALALGPDPRLVTLRAEADLAMGNAAEAAKRLAPLWPEGRSAPVGVRLGEALLASGDRTQAATVLGEVLRDLDAARSPQLAGRAHVALARLAQSDGRFDDAEREYAAALAAVPDDVTARLEQALARWDRGQATGARTALDALAASPAGARDARVLLAAARLRLATGDRAGAGKLLDSAARLEASPAALVARERGRLALASGRVPEAVRELAAALSGMPDDVEARLLHLDALLARGSEIKEARAAAAEIEKRFPGTAEAFVAKGKLYLAVDRTPRPALAALLEARKKRVIAGAPPRVLAEAALDLGRAHDASGDLDAALADYGEAAKLDPGNAEASHQRGRALLVKKQFAAASQALTQALKDDPQLADAWFLLGEAELAQKKRATARSALEAYLRLAPRGDNAAGARQRLKRLR
jgi:tetratricopeptide (TPR) repeat protein